MAVPPCLRSMSGACPAGLMERKSASSQREAGEASGRRESGNRPALEATDPASAQEAQDFDQLENDAGFQPGPWARPVALGHVFERSCKNLDDGRQPQRRIRFPLVRPRRPKPSAKRT